SDPNNVPGYTERRYGGMIGIDYTLLTPGGGNWILGGLFDYSHDTATFKENAGKTTVNNYQFGLYGQYRGSPWYVNALVAGGLGDFDTTRNILLPTVDPGGNVVVNDPTAHATYTGWNYGAYVEGGWDFPVNNFRVTPFVGLGYLHQKLDDFVETGAGLANMGVSGDANCL